jgi:NAD(P)-dependent dehydrogenase (short-subunit alcohol dehydrogenase family)
MPTDQPSPLAGRCSIVTGGGQGLGGVIARRLAELGARVAVLDVDAPAARDCAAELERAGAESIALACDVANRASVAAAVGTAAARLGPVELLVNNAAVLSTTPFLELTDAEWRRTLAVDYSGVLHCCHETVPGMVQRGFGRVVNVASVAALRGGGLLGAIAYATAKAGVLGLTRALARELATTGVTVHAVVPGPLATDMTRVLDEDEEAARRVLATVPLGRRGTVEEVAAVVGLLACGLPVAAGEEVAVDGGVLMR